MIYEFFCLQSYTFFAKLQTHWQKNRSNSGCQALDVKFGSHLFVGKCVISNKSLLN